MPCPSSFTVQTFDLTRREEFRFIAAARKSFRLSTRKRFLLHCADEKPIMKQSENYTQRK